MIVISRRVVDVRQWQSGGIVSSHEKVRCVPDMMIIRSDRVTDAVVTRSDLKT